MDRSVNMRVLEIILNHIIQDLDTKMEGLWSH